MPAAGKALTPEDLAPSEREQGKLDLTKVTLETLAQSPDVSNYIRSASLWLSVRKGCV
jgi:hypothetical protein